MDANENPYRSPEHDSTPIATSPTGNWRGRRTYPYASGHTRAILVVALLSLDVLSQIVGAAIVYSEIGILQLAKAGVQPTQSQADVNNLAMAAAGLSQSVIRIVTIVFFLMWTHRITRNLPALKANVNTYSPRWAVGWFFVPIANLIRPYQVMREAWRGSDPGTMRSTESPSIIPRGSSTALVGLWWATYLIMAIYGNIEMRGSLLAGTIDTVLARDWMTLVGSGITVAAAVPAIMLVLRINRFQTQRNAMLEAQPELQPAIRPSNNDPQIDAMFADPEYPQGTAYDVENDGLGEEELGSERQVEGQVEADWRTWR